MKIISIGEKIDRKKLQQIVKVVLAGGVIVYPTDTIYGLGGNAFDENVIDRIYKLKGRDRRKPLLILVSGKEMILPLVKKVPMTARKLMGLQNPGPLTIIYEASERIPHKLYSLTGRIGIRIPKHKWCLSICKLANVPLISTSANRSGESEIFSVENLKEGFQGIDLFIDAGPVPASASSTVIDVTTSPPVILRDGAVKLSQIENIVGKIDVK